MSQVRYSLALTSRAPAQKPTDSLTHLANDRPGFLPASMQALRRIPRPQALAPLRPLQRALQGTCSSGHGLGGLACGLADEISAFGMPLG